MSADAEIAPYDVDEPLLARAREQGAPQLAVYRPPAPVVVLGRGSKVEQELHLRACLERGVPLTRRRGGGCAVVLDPGNVVVSVALPVQGIGDNPRHFRRLSAWLIHGLTRAGWPGVRQAGISDLALGQHKVGGACIYRTRGLLYYSASLLLEPRLELIERYLRHPPREPDYRAGRGHREFLASLPLPAGSIRAAADAPHRLRPLLPLDALCDRD